ncbi:hypothetical protein ACFL2V_20380 [Pseudomonadota bacterium]
MKLLKRFTALSLFVVMFAMTVVPTAFALTTYSDANNSYDSYRYNYDYDYDYDRYDSYRYNDYDRYDRYNRNDNCYRWINGKRYRVNNCGNYGYQSRYADDDYYEYRNEYNDRYTDNYRYSYNYRYSDNYRSNYRYNYNRYYWYY